MYDFVRKKWFIEKSGIRNNMQVYSSYEKEENEKAMSLFIDKADKYFRRKPVNKKQLYKWQEEGKELFKSFFEKDKIFNLNGLSSEVQDSTMEMSRDFINSAREFDKNISEIDIIQALRNIWIIAILQVMFDSRVCLTRSIFAYSMIYPYSDNFLDDKHISDEAKNQFNNRLYARLKGNKVQHNSELEKKIYNLIKDIEGEYDRKLYPEVYKSLLEIQDGQTISMKQQEKLFVPYETDILDISIKKGAASVLADGYLIKGRLSESEEKFCLEYGAVLQFVDDFQDLKSDKKCNHTTIMSQLAGRYHLDKIINKLINYVYDLFESTELLKGKDDLKEVIISNCRILILCSIAINKEYFSEEYVETMGEFMPFTIEYIEKLNKMLTKKIRKTGALV